MKDGRVQRRTGNGDAGGFGPVFCSVVELSGVGVGVGGRETVPRLLRCHVFFILGVSDVLRYAGNVLAGREDGQPWRVNGNYRNYREGVDIYA